MTKTACKVNNTLFQSVFFSTHFVDYFTIIFMCKFRVLVLESIMVQGSLFKGIFHCLVFNKQTKITNCNMQQQ